MTLRQPFEQSGQLANVDPFGYVLIDENPQGELVFFPCFCGSLEAKC